MSKRRTHAAWLRTELDRALTVLENDFPDCTAIDAYLMGWLLGAAELSDEETAAHHERVARLRRGEKS